MHFCRTLISNFVLLRNIFKTGTRFLRRKDGHRPKRSKTGRLCDAREQRTGSCVAYDRHSRSESSSPTDIPRQAEQSFTRSVARSRRQRANIVVTVFLHFGEMRHSEGAGNDLFSVSNEYYVQNTRMDFNRTDHH